MIEFKKRIETCHTLEHNNTAEAEYIRNALKGNKQNHTRSGEDVKD